MDQHNLDEVYDFAVRLGKDAGSMLLATAQARMSSDSEHASTTVEYVEKDNAVDIVTKVDKDVEAFIHQSISSKYPEHEFIGEETYSAGTSRQYLVKDGPTWIVDPLDGTVNYTHSFPMYCVSIAFCIGGKPIIGVINAPALNQLFSSRLGKGAWLNESQRLPLLRNPVPTLPQDAPRGCVFSCEWGKDRRDRPEGNLWRKVDSFVTMAAERTGRSGKGGMAHGVRSLGSAALDLAYTAMGSFDIWWEGGCWEWDVAAGIAILEEAGGLITTANPPANTASDPIPEAALGGRLYLAIRPAGSTPVESSLEAQRRVVRAVWERVKELDYKRP